MTAMRLKRYPSPSGGIALGKMGVGATLMKQLPYDAEVEYLESTGTQWIDTGYRLNNDCRIEILLTAETTSKRNSNVFGCRTSFASKNFSCNMVPNYGYTVAFDNSDTTDYRATSDAPSKFLARIVADKNERTVYNETAGTTLVTNTTACPDVFTCDYSAYLFNMSGSPWKNYLMVGRLYSCKIWQNGELVRDFIPVRFTNENGVSEGAVYDRANPTVGMNPDGSPRDDGLYLNRGTGDFGRGPDIN